VSCQSILEETNTEQICSSAIAVYSYSIMF